jgi:creatinine amidohydrolase/Fe(II)-dependent formamide hydrolase-like protein
MGTMQTNYLSKFRRSILGAGILFVLLIIGGLCIITRAERFTPLGPLADLSAPNPLAAFGSLELESLTWMDIRDRIRAGTTRILVPTGGVEQNGPFVAVSKHNHIARAVSVRIAELLGSTLVAPVVAFVPQGSISPPTDHMRYPGTISLRQTTFENLLEDIAMSLTSHGFTEIVLLGDSFGNQEGLKNVAGRLSQRLRAQSIRVLHIPEFYDYPSVHRFLAANGIHEQPEPFHEDLAFSLQLLTIAPDTIRYEERIAVGRTTLGGISLLDREKLTRLGREIIELRARSTAEAIRARAPTIN